MIKLLQDIKNIISSALSELYKFLGRFSFFSKFNHVNTGAGEQEVLEAERKADAATTIQSAFRSWAVRRQAALEAQRVADEQAALEAQRIANEQAAQSVDDKQEAQRVADNVAAPLFSGGGVAEEDERQPLDPALDVNKEGLLINSDFVSKELQIHMPCVPIIKDSRMIPRLLLGNKQAATAFNKDEEPFGPNGPLAPHRAVNFWEFFSDSTPRHYLEIVKDTPSKVKYVMNCSHERTESENLTRYEFLNIIEGTNDIHDNYDTKCTPEKFEEYAKTIDEMLGQAMAQDSAVLVCCQGGNHRSASVVVYWVATRFGLTFEKAHEEVSKLRDIKEYGDAYAKIAGTKDRSTAMGFAQKAVKWHRESAASYQPR